MISRGTPVQVRPGVLGLDMVDIGTLTGVALHPADDLDRVMVAIDWFGGGAEPQPVRLEHLLILCPTCESTPRDALAPRHSASPRCESGRRDHCSCDTCF